MWQIQNSTLLQMIKKKKKSSDELMPKIRHIIPNSIKYRHEQCVEIDVIHTCISK